MVVAGSLFVLMSDKFMNGAIVAIVAFVAAYGALRFPFLEDPKTKRLMGSAFPVNASKARIHG